jgi:hypothetical protein
MPVNLSVQNMQDWLFIRPSSFFLVQHFYAVAS